MNDALIGEIAAKVARAAIDEYEKLHHCPLTAIQVKDLAMVSGFLTRVRNALGNAVMVILAAGIGLAVAAVLYLVSAGKINFFKVFGL